MKRIFIGITALSICLVSCTKEESVNTGASAKSNEISFSTYSNIAKGTPYTSNDDFKSEGNSFGVAAFIFDTDDTSLSDSPYLGNDVNGAEITYTTDWEHAIASDIRYWPTNGEQLDFYAYTPFLDDGESLDLSFDKTTGLTISDYVVPTTEADQVDFMFASALDITTPENFEDVLLQFNHALVQVHFTAKTASDNMYVVIAENGISINNIYSTGDFDIFADEASTGAWSDQETPETYVFTSSEVTIDSEGDSESITATENSLMLLPQEFDAWDVDGGVAATDASQTGAYLTITCKIYTKTADDDIIYLVGSDGTDTEVAEYVTIYLPISSIDDCSNQIWQIGNKLTYDLSFGGGYDVDGNPILNPITFDAEVTGWI